VRPKKKIQSIDLQVFKPLKYQTQEKERFGYWA
jgi:hypothetical protein